MLIICMLGNLANFYLDLIFFSKKIPFQKRKKSGIPSECQKVLIQIRPDETSGLLWVKTVCKRYQKTSLAGKGLNTLLIDFQG